MSVSPRTGMSEMGRNIAERDQEEEDEDNWGDESPAEMDIEDPATIAHVSKDDKALLLQVRFRVKFLRDVVQYDKEQGNILEQHLVRSETLYARTTSKTIKYETEWL